MTPVFDLSTQESQNLSQIPLGLYIHIPFCSRKCHYCDFTSGPVGNHQRRSHLQALESEIAHSPQRGATAKTVFFGGGTPSELRCNELAGLVSVLRRHFHIQRQSEWTIECNPGFLRSRQLEQIRRLGFNRISLGVQCFDNEMLQYLGRTHTAQEARDSIRRLRQTGFDNLNLDLLFGLPGQSLAAWKSGLEEALAWEPEHLSLHNLSIEPGTQFGRQLERGQFIPPSDRLTAEMFELAMDLTAAVGFQQYEICHYARPGRCCRHNQIYWQNQPYLGFGLSAASFLKGKRWVNTDDYHLYARTAPSGRPARRLEEKLPPLEALGEALFLLLRTSRGADLQLLQAIYGLPVENLYRESLDFLQNQGLIARLDSAVVLTRRGKLVADSVCAEFLRPQSRAQFKQQEGLQSLPDVPDTTPLVPEIAVSNMM